MLSTLCRIPALCPTRAGRLAEPCSFPLPFSIVGVVLRVTAASRQQHARKPSAKETFAWTCSFQPFVSFAISGKNDSTTADISCGLGDRGSPQPRCLRGVSEQRSHRPPEFPVAGTAPVSFFSPPQSRSLTCSLPKLSSMGGQLDWSTRAASSYTECSDYIKI